MSPLCRKPQAVWSHVRSRTNLQRRRGRKWNNLMKKLGARNIVRFGKEVMDFYWVEEGRGPLLSFFDLQYETSILYLCNLGGESRAHMGPTDDKRPKIVCYFLCKNINKIIYWDKQAFSFLQCLGLNFKFKSKWFNKLWQIFWYLCDFFKAHVEDLAWIRQTKNLTCSQSILIHAAGKATCRLPHKVPGRVLIYFLKQVVSTYLLPSLGLAISVEMLLADFINER